MSYSGARNQNYSDSYSSGPNYGSGQGNSRNDLNQGNMRNDLGQRHDQQGNSNSYYPDRFGNDPNHWNQNESNRGRQGPEDDHWNNQSRGFNQQPERFGGGGRYQDERERYHHPYDNDRNYNDSRTAFAGQGAQDNQGHFGGPFGNANRHVDLGPRGFGGGNETGGTVTGMLRLCSCLVVAVFLLLFLFFICFLFCFLLFPISS
jgi:hypothetical protein